MIAATPAIRLVAPLPPPLPAPSHLDVRPRAVALLVACVAFDAVAAGILLVGTTLPPPLEGLTAGIAHGVAVLLVFGSSYARPGRRWLCAAAVLVVPLVGAAVAAAILATRGRGLTAMARRRRARPRPALTKDAMQRLEGGLSLYDALDSGDEEQRRAALSALSRRGDPEAIALLRRAAAGRDPDLALSAALALDEIGERVERQAEPLDPTETRRDAP